MWILSPKNDEKICLANQSLTDLVGNYTPGYAERYNLGEDHFSMQGLTLKWGLNHKPNSYLVCLSEKKDLLNGVKFYTQEPWLKCEDLLVNTEYFWQVIAYFDDHEEVSPTYRFQTADTPRTLRIDGVSNTRDLGGRNLQNGKKIRQGMVYRGGRLDEITEEGKRTAKAIYGIKTDLDLRNFAEGTAGQISPLGEEIRYVHINNSPYYLGGETGIDVEKNKKILGSAIKLFADVEKYPIYVHCSLGRDRTAAVCMLLEGLLGVAKRDIMVDYETSFLSKMGSLDGQTATYMEKMFSKTYDYVAGYAKDDFALACENYLLEAGLTADEITRIREILMASS